MISISFILKCGLFFLLIISSSLRAEVIQMRADAWCPYTCGPESDRPGFMVEIAREIFKASGITVEYQSLNWARAVAETRAGKYDAVIGANRGDVPGFVLPTIPQGMNINYFWSLKDSDFQYRGIDSLKNRRIGVINGYSYGGDELDLPIKNRHPAFDIIPGEDALVKMIKMTEAKRIDAFVENPYVLLHLLKTDLREYENSFKPVSRNIVSDSELFIAFTPAKKESNKYAKILSVGMTKLRKSGKLKIILDKYDIKDWK